MSLVIKICLANWMESVVGSRFISLESLSGAPSLEDQTPDDIRGGVVFKESGPFLVGIELMALSWLSVFDHFISQITATEKYRR